MIRFERRGEEIEVEIEKIAEQFINSVYALMPGGFVISMIHYLEHLGENEGMQFKRLNGSDWSKLRAAVIKVSQPDTVLS